MTKKIAHSTHSKTLKHGAYIPRDLKKGKRVCGSIVNIDAQVDTPDGKNTFHGTALAIYQENVDQTEESSTVLENLVKEHEAEGQTRQTEVKAAVPPTVVDVIKSGINGNPKPSRSPKYEEFELGKFQEIVKARLSDTAWLLLRFRHRPRNPIGNVGDLEEERVQNIPVWSAFISQCTSFTNRTYIYSLPIVNAPANEWNTLVTALYQIRNISLLTEPNVKHSQSWCFSH